ncbi:MAG: exodeoxyribonuclease VII small subunit [Firmicutes bacterium]|nr:exodeoxyribonuclease VII small subunit [Bacillota bacterium]
MPKKKTSFETDIARLAEIVEQVENSETPLDVAISLYKEGLELAAKCGKTLGQYEEQILTLQKDVDGNLIMEVFGNESFQ